MKHLKTGFFMPLNPLGMLITGTYMVLYGLWLFSPLWDAFAVTDTLYQLLLVVPEWLIGSVTTILGLLVCLWPFWPDRRLRWAGLASGLLWFAIAITLFLGNWQSTTWLASLLPSALCINYYLNLSVNKSQNLTHNRR